jgi:hypothetical protein
MGNFSKASAREKIVNGQPSAAVKRVHSFQGSGTPRVKEM